MLWVLKHYSQCKEWQLWQIINLTIKRRRSLQSAVRLCANTTHRLRCGHLNCMRPFKYSVYWTRKILESLPHSLFPLYIMFFGQINASATLPIYVLMHLINSKFLRTLYTSSRRLFFMLYNETFLLLLRNVTQNRPAENNTVKPHSHRKAYCYLLTYSMEQSPSWEANQ